MVSTEGTEYLQIRVYTWGFSMEDYPCLLFFFLGGEHREIGVPWYGNTVIKEKGWKVVPMPSLVF